MVGHVGAGKSSLISALLGEMEKLEGYVSIKVCDVHMFFHSTKNSLIQNFLGTCTLVPSMLAADGYVLVEAFISVHSSYKGVSKQEKSSDI